MRKLTNTLFALVAMLFACAQMDAQQVICPATGPMPAEQAITTSIFITNETPTADPTLCTYDVQAIVETTDASMAIQDVEVVITASATSPFTGDIIVFTRTITLDQGSISITAPTPAFTTNPIPCGLPFDFMIEITGGSPCLGTSFFPVELTKFDATISKNNKIRLAWETASELDNQGFEIERSREGKKWETLDFVKGTGTTSEVQRYEWMDEKPYQEDLNYYRLKQMDFDGTTEYSAIVVAEMKSDKREIEISPNPASQFLNVRLGELEQEAVIEVYNSNGQVVKSIIASRNDITISLDISDLPSSVYWMIVSSGNTKQQQKFVKL